jgi:hypothetical protein
MKRVNDATRADFVEAWWKQERTLTAQLAPRPGTPAYGLAAPALEPVDVAAYQIFNSEWTTITLGYDDARTGPYVTVTVTTTVADTQAEPPREWPVPSVTPPASIPAGSASLSFLSRTSGLTVRPSAA